MSPTTPPGSSVSLTDDERDILRLAGTTPDPNGRQRAVAIVLARHGADRDDARDLLVAGYLSATQPSFHMIPRGDAMADEVSFIDAYERLAVATGGFHVVTPDTLRAVLLERPDALAPLRMVLGFTHNELASAARQWITGSKMT